VNKPDSSDSDARFGRFPRQKIEPGYKQHTVADGNVRGVPLVSPPPKVRTHTGDAYFTVEEFEYDEGTDEFVCPAGKRLPRCGRSYLWPRNDEERSFFNKDRCPGFTGVLLTT